MSDETTPAADSAEQAPSRRGRKRLLALVFLLLAGGIAWVVYQRSTHVYTDDARVATELVVISSKVAGRVEQMAVKEGATVSAGDLIAQLDVRETELRVEELKAQLKATEASIAQAEAEHTMVAQQTEGSLHAAESGLEAARAELASAISDEELKHSEWERAQSLRERGILSQQNWEQTRSSYQMARQNQNRAQAQVAAAEAGLQEARAARDRLAVLQQQQVRLRHDRERVMNQLKGQQVNLDELRVVSPLDGIVDQTFVNRGEYVMPGQRIALIHDPANVWISANIKETQIRHLAVGQAVKVSVDAYPDREFRGHVERIGNAATSQFALFPSTNPSGNFTKVTQRLPVKVAVEQEELLLKPGMMVEIAIELRHD